MLNIKYFFFALLISTLFTSNSALSQVYSSNPVIHNFDDNTFVTIDEIFKEFEGLQDFSKEYQSNGEEYQDYIKLTRHNFGYTLIAKYLNQSRKIPHDKKRVLDFGIDALNIDSSFKQILQNEVFVEIDGQKIWIPIQNELYEIWKTNVAASDSVLIYTRIIGGYQAEPENRWLLMIFRFHESLQTVLWNEGIQNLNRGNDEVGERYLTKLIALYPNDAEAIASLAYYYTEKGVALEGSEQQIYFLKADSLFQDAEKISPNYAFQYFQRAILKFHQARYQDSWRLIEKAKKHGLTNIEDKFMKQLSSAMTFDEYNMQKQ